MRKRIYWVVSVGLLLFFLVLGITRIVGYLVSQVPHPTYEELLKDEDERIKALPKQTETMQKQDTSWMNEDNPIDDRPSMMYLDSQQYFIEEDEEVENERYWGETTDV